MYFARLDIYCFKSKIQRCGDYIILHQKMPRLVSNMLTDRSSSYNCMVCFYLHQHKPSTKDTISWADTSWFGFFTI